MHPKDITHFCVLWIMTIKLPNYLRMHRRRHGLSQAELASLIGGQSGTRVSRYERGSRLPSLETALAFEAIFKTSVHELFAGVGERVELRVCEQAKLLLDRVERLQPTPEVEYKKKSIGRIVSPYVPLFQEVHTNKGRALESRVIALDPTSHGFGFVVFEGGTRLVDWGHAHARPCTNEKCLEMVAKLFAYYFPRLVVMEDWDSKESRRGARVRKLFTQIVEFTEASHAKVTRFSQKDIQRAFSTDGSPTKYEIAQMIALEFPELSFRLPPPRKIWMSEDERMSIFDAVALALTFFQTREEV